MTDRSKVDELADYFDTHDTTEELEAAQFEPAEPVAEPMVTYALRLPKPVLDRLRAVSEARGVKVTALMRLWLEDRLTREDAGGPAAVVDVSDLLAFVAERARTTGDRPDRVGA